MFCVLLYQPAPVYTLLSVAVKFYILRQVFRWNESNDNVRRHQMIGSTCSTFQRLYKGSNCCFVFCCISPPLSEDEKYYRKQPLTTKEVFKEQISQRLAQVKQPAPNCIKHFHWLIVLFWPIMFDVTIVSTGNNCNFKPD